MRKVSQKDYAPKNGWRKGSKFPLIRIAIALITILIVYNLLQGSPEKETLQTTKIETITVKSDVKVKQKKQTSEIIELPPVKQKPIVSIASLQPDKQLAHHVMEVLKTQKPYGAFYLMVDGESGQILAWGQNEHFKAAHLPTYLARTEFPAASLSKIVTAAAALESRRYSNHTLIPAIGSGVTLYRKQLKAKKNYNGRKVSLEKAFASSMNPPMAIVGLSLGGKVLKKTAAQLGFNLDYPVGIPIESCFNPPDKGFGVAEAACGFTSDVTISPLHTAAIVRSILNGTEPELPWSPRIGKQHAPLGPNKLLLTPFTENTYYGLRRMFEATIKYGSARGAFNNAKVLYSYNKKRLRIGGKTGTKDSGDSRYEWFTGYVQDRKDFKKSLILVCLHINEIDGTRASHPVQAAALLINYWAKSYLKW